MAGEKRREEDKWNSVFRIPSEFVQRPYGDGMKLPDYREEFMRDRDRIMYSTAFRRLAGKTQIYTLGNDDHKRNRLTHTLEVAQLSRTIAHALHLDENLAESIAYGHDLGHTPFGHAGEQILNELTTPSKFAGIGSPFSISENDLEKKIAQAKGKKSKNKKNLFDNFSTSNIVGFKHNLQSVRLALYLEDSYRDDKGQNIGLNLTNYTMWGMQNHSAPKYNSEDKSPNYQDVFKNRIMVKDEFEARSFEAYIVKIADDIAQWHHDLEDALRGHAMSPDNIWKSLNEILGKSLNEDDAKMFKELKTNFTLDRKVMASLSHIVVNTLVNDLEENSMKNLKKIYSKLTEMEDIDYAKTLYSDYDKMLAKKVGLGFDEVISFSSKMKKKTESFKTTIRSYVHHSFDVERMNSKGKYIIKKLFEAYYANPQQLPNGPILHFMVETGRFSTLDEAKKADIGNVRTEFEKAIKDARSIEADKENFIELVILTRRICDHIACMTDRFAMEEYNNLYG